MAAMPFLCRDPFLPKYYTICGVFQPAFVCCVHPKAGQTTFFQPYSTFFDNFKPFSVISRLNQQKMSENKQQP